MQLSTPALPPPRRMTLRKLRRVALLALAGYAMILPQAQAQEQTSAVSTELGKEFKSETAKTNGTTIHYVRGGNGPAVILIHGFPLDWSEYRAIMPRLAKRFTVIAVDLRGIGGSSATPGGYDAANMAEDVCQLAAALKLEHPYVVGHDLGAMVAFAFARRYPDMTRGAMILDAPIPGIAGWAEFQADPTIWHVRFMQVPGLAEKLVDGRQAEYFSYFFNFGKFSTSDIPHFVSSYANPAQIHAAFEMYRAFPANEQFNLAKRGASEVPLFLAAGEGSPFASLLPKMAEGLRANGFTHIATGLIEGGVHYLLEDQPDAVAQLIEKYASTPQ
jgi:pimeloyl-ACP methyl ester carboxylesterase